MPPQVLSTLANGLVMGKILAACPLTIPVRLNDDDRSFVSITEEINKAIKATARTITKTKLSDKIPTERVLWKANLRCLNEAVASITALTVWKAKQTMNPLGQCLFQDKTGVRLTRAQTSKEVQVPVPGYPYVACNKMARIWNNVHELRNTTTLGAAKAIARKWAKDIPR